LKNGLTFDDDGVIRFVDPTADREDGEKKKMKGRQEENCKTRKSEHSRRHVESAEPVQQLHVHDDAHIQML
jgi:hypothetical protein